MKIQIYTYYGSYYNIDFSYYYDVVTYYVFIGDYCVGGIVKWNNEKRMRVFEMQEYLDYTIGHVNTIRQGVLLLLSKLINKFCLLSDFVEAIKEDRYE